VVSHGWHTGIVFHSQDIPDSLFEQPFFPDRNYIEFGWGDRAYYMDPEAGNWTAIKAAIWPTAGVMHVVGFDLPVDDYFSLSRNYPLEIGRDGRDKLLLYLIDSFTRGEDRRFIRLGEGLYGESQFYESDHTYIFPKTCNVWTAGGLKEAGFDLTPLFYQRATTLMDQVQEFAESQKQ
jgi:uncharacterized protein (TIGR02117 family)